VTIWLDAHVSPAMAPWLAAKFQLTAISVRDLGLRDAQDPTIFANARIADAIVMTKDSDFAEMVQRMGPPPKSFVAVLWQHVERDASATSLTRVACGDRAIQRWRIPD
jgi:predicted nuclease of predicted toxin-antitoxin system